MEYDRKSDRKLRARVWSGLGVFGLVVWALVIVFIAAPACRALVDAAKAGPAACVHLDTSDRTACAEGL